MDTKDSIEKRYESKNPHIHRYCTIGINKMNSQSQGQSNGDHPISTASHHIP